MGNLWLKINYQELSAHMSKVISSMMALQEFLDEAAGSQTTKPGVCERDDCPNRLKDKGEG
jgi:hypothetical protein